MFSVAPANGRARSQGPRRDRGRQEPASSTRVLRRRRTRAPQPVQDETSSSSASLPDISGSTTSVSTASDHTDQDMSHSGVSASRDSHGHEVFEVERIVAARRVVSVAMQPAVWLICVHRLGRVTSSTEPATEVIPPVTTAGFRPRPLYPKSTSNSVSMSSDNVRTGGGHRLFHRRCDPDQCLHKPIDRVPRPRRVHRAHHRPRGGYHRPRKHAGAGCVAARGQQHADTTTPT